MNAQPVGTQLRERRESLGLSIDHMARVTNIRPRLLETFEANDYAKFPAKGYASGMLSSYARALGMDPRPILSGLELELADFNQKAEMAQGARNAMIGKDKRGFKRGTNPSTRRRGATGEMSRVTGSMEPVPGGQDTAGDIARATSAIKVVSKATKTRGGHRVLTGRDVKAQDRASSSRLDAYKRSLTDRYDDGLNEPASPSVTGSVRYGNAATTGRLTALAESTGSLPVVDHIDKEDYNDDYELRGGGRRRPRSRTGSKTKSRRYSTPVSEGIVTRIVGLAKGLLADKRLRLAAIAVVLIILALIFVASLLLSSAGSKDAGILDVTGGNDAASTTETSKDKATGAAVATITTANGNPVVVTVDVEKGKTSLVSITYDDDKAFDGTAVGPWHREFQVTQSFSATFGTPNAVKVEENGNPLEIPTTDDGSGKLEISVQASGLATSKKK